MEKIDFPKLLRYVIGLSIIVEGVDKFFNFLVDWEIYAAPLILDLWPFSADTFLVSLGVAEIAVGFVFLLHAKIGGWLVMGMMLGITINLLLLGNFYNMILLNIIIGLTSLFLANLQKPDEKKVSAI